MAQQQHDVFVILRMLFKFIWDVRDRKVDGWFLMDSFVLNLVLAAAYVGFVTWFGPKLMETRKAFNFKYIFVVFLFGLFIMNVVIHVQFWKSGWGNGYKAACEELDETINEDSLRMASACWWYFILKYMDCCYTVFNVLQKRFYKVTVQQVIHHTSMLVNGWCMVRFLPGGHMTFVGLVNTFLHAVLYLYYTTSNIDPKSWYRKPFSILATWINLVALFLISGYLLLPYFLQCNYSGPIITYTVSSALLYILLFVQEILTKKNDFNENENEIEHNNKSNSLYL